jgi:hypothetical protein
METSEQQFHVSELSMQSTFEYISLRHQLLLSLHRGFIATNTAQTRLAPSGAACN